ncbi:MAG TPA: methyltransferase domain-containing protein [Labilithrix sp.]|nr:methyltransferase domain-containing protein [Labilithrix sp.]
MKKDLLGPALLPVLALCLSAAVGAAGCGDSPEVKAPPPPAIVEPPPATTPPPPVTPPPAEPTAEEKKKAEQLKQLSEDRAKAEAEHKKEVERWTPELKTEAKALVEKAFPNGKAAIQGAMASKTRQPGRADRDKFRHPAETLDFFGFKPTLTVLEFGPGEGWYTELLAPTLAKKGKLLATITDPNGPADQRSTYYGQIFKMFLDTSPELYGKVETVTIDGKAPKLPQDGTVDLVVLAREMHGMVNNGKLEAWLAEFHKALKPNGLLGVEQHRAKADAKAEESAKNGYLPEKWVIEKVEAAGFKLAGKSEINANAKDTKDYPKGVWTLPPSLNEGDKDREKYMAIGESDRMTLKFTKVAKPAPKTDKPAAATPPAKPAAPVTPAAPVPPKKP